MNFWIAISTRENARVVEEKGVWGVANRYRPTLAKVKTGDRMVVYAKGGYFVGAYEVASELFVDDDEIFFQKIGNSWRKEFYRNRIKVRPIVPHPKEVPVRAILSELQFLRNYVRWGGYFWRALVQIEQDDYEIIAQALTENDYGKKYY